MRYLVFDCETGPLPEAELLSAMPPFDSSAVKIGNYGPEAAARKINEAEAKHKADYLDKAALDPLTGQVVAIGVRVVGGDGPVILGESGNETELLKQFWDCCRSDHGRLLPLVGFNTHLFDLPFLYKRSWKHGITPPAGYRNGRYWANSTDLREVWQMGDRQAHGSLGRIAKHLGLAGKLDEVSGKFFHQLWNGTPEDRQQAIDYLVRDVEMTEQVAVRLGVIHQSREDAL